MSLRMFVIFGLMPVFLAIAGLVAKVSLQILFVAAGILMLSVTLLAPHNASFAKSTGVC
jgi:hypothetical protein